MRLGLTIVAYLAALALVGLVCGFAVLVLAGPHGGVMPAASGNVVLALAWGIVLVVPAFVARAVWRRIAPGSE